MPQDFYAKTGVRQDCKIDQQPYQQYSKSSSPSKGAKRTATSIINTHHEACREQPLSVRLALPHDQAQRHAHRVLHHAALERELRVKGEERLACGKRVWQGV
jgi:hypothetical protein